jgi:hypothetical protein
MEITMKLEKRKNEKKEIIIMKNEMKNQKLFL